MMVVKLLEIVTLSTLEEHWKVYVKMLYTVAEGVIATNFVPASSLFPQFLNFAAHNG